MNKLTLFKTIFNNFIQKESIDEKDFIFSLYHFTSDEYKENYRLLDVINGDIIDLEIKDKHFYITIPSTISKNISVDEYFEKKYYNSSFYKLLENLFSYQYHTYLQLYLKYELNVETNEYIDYRNYLRTYSKKIPKFLQNKKEFEKK